MDTDGVILNINSAFNLRFGYAAHDLLGKNFSILFTDEDRAVQKPEREVEQVKLNGSANDENYLVKKDGTKVWVTGESVLIENKQAAYILKVVHNIHAQKQLERFLLQSHEFIDTVFDSIEESALLLLDSRLRVLKVNKAFIELFELGQTVMSGNRLTDLNHDFWRRPDVKQELVSYLTMNSTVEEKTFDLQTKTGLQKIMLKAKLIEGTKGIERKLLVMINKA